LLCFVLLSSFSISSIGQQRGTPARPDEFAQLKKQIESLEERVDRLEKRLDKMSRPRMIPLICIGVPKEFP